MIALDGPTNHLDIKASPGSPTTYGGAGPRAATARGTTTAGSSTGRHHNMGSARRNRRTFRRRLRVRAAARRAGPADRGEAKRRDLLRRSWLGRAAAHRRRPQAKFRMRPPTRRCRHRAAYQWTGQAGGRSARKGRRRPARRVGLVPAFLGGRPGVCDHRMADRRGERYRHRQANGAGKSTLLGLIAGTVSPVVGRVKRTADQIGYRFGGWGRSGTVALTGLLDVLGRLRGLR